MEAVRQQVVLDCVQVLKKQVDAKKGVSGMLVKGAFAVVRKLEGGRMLERSVDWLLDEFVETLEDYYEAYLQEDEATRPSFEQYLAVRSPQVSESLLSVTDGRRQRAKNKILIKSYDKLRPYAKKNVEEGVPDVGRLVQKFAFEQGTV